MAAVPWKKKWNKKKSVQTGSALNGLPFLPKEKHRQLFTQVMRCRCICFEGKNFAFCRRGSLWPDEGQLFFPDFCITGKVNSEKTVKCLSMYAEIQYNCPVILKKEANEK